MTQNRRRSLSPKDLMVNSDPLLRFIFQRNIWPLAVIAAVMFYDAVYVVLLPLLQGTFNQVLHDWPGLVRALITTPLLLAYYSWQPQTVQQLYEEVENRSPDQSDKDAEQLSDLIQPLGYRMWSWLGVIFGLFQAVLFYFSLSNGPLSWQSSTLVKLMSSLMTFLSFYGVLHIVIRQVITIVGINKFFRVIRVELSPLHPDRAGGLKPLGQYVITIGLGIGVIGLALGISILRHRMGLEQLQSAFFINLGLYVLSAPFFFFIPLMEAHHLMQKAKQNILLDVAGQYESLFRNSLVKVKAGKPFDKELLQLDSIRKMYTIAEGSPEWPFNLDVLSKFSAAVALPIILPVVMNYALGFIGGLLSV